MVRLQTSLALRTILTDAGINLAFVRLAVHSGARALIADLRLTDEAKAFIHQSSGNVAFVRCDVSDWRDLETLPSEVEKAFGSGAVAQVWIAGAALFEPKWTSFLYDQETDHYKALQVNTEHPIKLTRIAMRSCLGANKPGVVLIVASMAGITGSYGAALYCASKHAVVGFTKSMAQADVDEDIKIVCCCPGIVATPMWKGEAAKDIAAQYKYDEDKAIMPEDVADAMKDMVEQSKYKGGTLLEVSKSRMRGELESRQALVGDSPEMQAFMNHCYAPIREVWNKERGASVIGKNET